MHWGIAHKIQAYTCVRWHQGLQCKLTKGRAINKYPDKKYIGCLSQSKQGCKDQESIQSSTTPDPRYQWESDKLTVDTTNESQEVSPFPAGDHKAHINRRPQNIANTRQNKNIKDPQKKYRLGTVSYFLLEGLNQFNGANLTLNSEENKTAICLAWN